MGAFDSKKEKRKLNKIMENLPEDKRKLCQGLIADASFMAEQLEILREHIAVNGWSDEYQNGANQFGKKSSVEAEAYLRMQKSYAAVIKQLTDLLPDKLSAGDELMEFLND